MPAGVSRGSVPETTVSITDDDDACAVTVSFELGQLTASRRVDGDGDGDPVAPRPSGRGDITLIPARPRAGTSDDDYSLSATSLTFGPTETSKTFTFTATQDSVDDDEESVELSFGSPARRGV